jgi:DNA-binding phage protein
METLSQEAQYKLMKGWLNERQWRLYVATEARRIGPGGISQVAREAGVTRKTIRKGLGEHVYRPSLGWHTSNLPLFS